MIRKMDKKTAIATSAAVTLFIASTALAVAVAGVFEGEPAGRRAIVPASSERAAGGAPTTIVETRYVDDPYYVPGADPGGSSGAALSSTGAAAAGAASTGAGATAVSGAGTTGSSGGSEMALAATSPVAGATGSPSSSSGSSAPATASVPNPGAAAPTTAKPVAPTTVRPPTTTAAPPTTLPLGVRIPSDWPPGKPIPPIPPGCQKPQLEDNGVWNCDH